MAFFKKPKYATVTPPRKKDIPHDLYVRCPVSGDIIYTKDLEKNCRVVPKSGYHFPMDAPGRIEMLLDPGSFQEFDAGLTTVDALGFPSYQEKLERDRKKTGLNDAVVCGMGRIGGIALSVAVMDFRFMGGSMGSVIGEKITRAIERAMDKKTPLLVISNSGGARMQEGLFSLMQMAKTSAAIGRLNETDLPYISILTNPTAGGTTASFATLGDVILAEPGALICFAGPRVIKETTNEELPKGFQTAEFLMEAGLIDQIVPRPEMRGRLILFLRAFSAGNAPLDGRNAN